MNSNNYQSLLQKVEEEHEQSTKESLNINSRVLLVDGLNTFIRAFAANPAINDDGVHIGGLIGFLKSLRYTISILKPTRCIIAFDGKGGSKRRREIFKDYKGNRKVRQRFNRNVDWSTGPVDEKQAMRMQTSRLVKYLEFLPITMLTADNTEADDIIAYISRVVLKDSNKIIMSTDKDFLQLVDEKTTVWNPTKKKLYDMNRVQDEYGIYSKNFIIYKILDGDKSDNIPGIKGAGLKTIIKNIPQLTEEKEFTVKDLIKFVKNADKKTKLFENIKNNYTLLKRNYILMQLFDAEISNYNKLKIQNVIHEKVPQLIKYKFSVLFMQDKLWSQIKNMESWITEFIRLDRFRISNER
jgi:DNA polymerase-1